MNTMSRGVLARADLYDEILSMTINLTTLNEVNEHVWGESLELVIHEYLKIIGNKVESEKYIEMLINTICEVKKIPKDFYRCIWLLRFQDTSPQQKLDDLTRFYPSKSNDVDKQILKDVLCEIITLILRINPIDVVLLREYKEKLREVIQGENEI